MEKLTPQEFYCKYTFTPENELTNSDKRIINLIHVYNIHREKNVDGIIDTLCDRNGFDDWWYNLDEEIQTEIKEELKKYI